jgi:hypothetical protein
MRDHEQFTACCCCRTPEGAHRVQQPPLTRDHTQQSNAQHTASASVANVCSVQSLTAMSILIHDFGSNIRFAAEVVTANSFTKRATEKNGASVVKVRSIL